MAVHDFDTLYEHLGHEVEVVCYGNKEIGIVNVAIECTDCGMVLLDYDKSYDEELDGSHINEI